LLVHIGDPSSNQATTLESQVIHMIQELFGQTLTLLEYWPTHLAGIILSERQSISVSLRLHRRLKRKS
jgi:hypothetical protein